MAIKTALGALEFEQLNQWWLRMNSKTQNQNIEIRIGSKPLHAVHETAHQLIAIHHRKSCLSTLRLRALRKG